MMRRGRRRLLWGGLILSLLLLTGCGEGIKSTSGGGGAAAGIQMSGGSGDPEAAAALGITEASASGGSCGYMQLESSGDLRILSEGTVDASFTVPEIEHDFGAVHYTVTGDETVALNPELPVTGLYVEAYSETLYLDDGDGDTEPQTVTGLTVPVGATLRLPTTYTGDGYNYTYLWFDNDMAIDGTVTLIDEEADIDLETGGNLVIGETGVITTKPETAGSNGGGIYLYAEGVAVNNGSLISDGADGDSDIRGGYAGYAQISADGIIYNTGTLSANGGANAEGSAGSAGSVYLYSYYSSLYTSGTLTSQGGTATNGNGGDGDYISLCAACYIGDRSASAEAPVAPTQLVVSGVLTNNGGDAENGNAGDVDSQIELYNNGEGNDSGVLVNAEMSSRGGTAVGGSGGRGYGVYVYANNGGAQIGGSIDVSGGNGLVGANGGWIEVYTYGAGQSLDLVGFDGIAMNGGDGDSGGSGGRVELYTYASWDGEIELPAAGIVVDVPISVNGGTGTVYGGDGGEISMYTDYEWDLSDETTYITNSAGHSTAGGDGGTSGGSGGDIYFYSARSQDPELPATVDNAEGAHDVSGGTGGDEDGSDGEVYYDLSMT